MPCGMADRIVSMRSIVQSFYHEFLYVCVKQCVSVPCRHVNGIPSQKGRGLTRGVSSFTASGRGGVQKATNRRPSQRGGGFIQGAVFLTMNETYCEARRRYVEDIPRSSLQTARACSEALTSNFAIKYSFENLNQYLTILDSTESSLMQAKILHCWQLKMIHYAQHVENKRKLYSTSWGNVVLICKLDIAFFGSHLIQLAELHKVEPSTLLRFARATKRFS